jgi:hypothetical protein
MLPCGVLVARIPRMENAVTHSFAGVVHFHDFRRKGEHLASSSDQTIEVDFHVRRIVDEAKPGFANFGDSSRNLKAGRKNRTRITLGRLNQDGAHGRAGFGTVGGDRIEQTDPKRFASRQILAARKAWTGEREKYEQTSERGKVTYNTPQPGNRRARHVETIQVRHCCCPADLHLFYKFSLSQRGLR